MSLEENEMQVKMGLARILFKFTLLNDPNVIINCNKTTMDSNIRKND